MTERRPLLMEITMKKNITSCIAKALQSNDGVIFCLSQDQREPLHYVAEAGHFLLLPEFSSEHKDVDFNCSEKVGWHWLSR